jgi:predicted AlkP superfamily pyrophosphatase or phosphodiesterase
MTITSQDQDIADITKDDVSFYIEKSQEEIEALPLGQLLYENGFTLIDQVRFKKDDKETGIYNWNRIAELTTIRENGHILIDGEEFSPDTIDITESNLTSDIHLSIMDIAPTVADFLELSNLPGSTHKAVLSGEAAHAVLILLDGLQFEKLHKLINAGNVPFFQSLQNIERASSVYPPITTSATAALLTGTPPEVNGVYGYGYRSTETMTVFDLAAQQYKTVIAVEGASLPFNLRNAEITLSGDRDGNGYSDDNVCMNSLEVIKTNMPDLIYIHFHEIDDMGHNFGPDSEEYEDAIIRVDEYLSQIYQALPDHTFIAIFADHGMHKTEDGGNHGTLTAVDLIIPIIFLEK